MREQQTLTIPSAAGCLALSVAAFAVACAHAQGGTADSLKATAKAFHERVRWKDFRSAADLLVADRREPFAQLLAERGDEKDLTITDYELEEAQLAADGLSAMVTSRLSWVRLPSPTENSERVKSSFRFVGGAWFLVRQEGGPFADALGSPYVEPK